MGGAKPKPSLRREKERKNIKLASPKVIKMTECNICGFDQFRIEPKKLFKFISLQEKIEVIQTRIKREKQRNEINSSARWQKIH